MEHSLKIPWWEFRPTDFVLPGSVARPDARAEERLVAGFLHAAARAETADYFISANSLNVAGVLDILSREELVLPVAPGWASKGQCHHETHQPATGLDVRGHPQLGCRSRLFGMPLADRHAVLTAACSLRHKLPRRALVNFVCRLVLGKDAGHLPSPQADDEYGCPLMNEAPRRQGGEGFCACGRRAILARDVGTRPRGHVTSSGSAAAGTSTACRSCLARRAWLDSVSARLLVMACRKLLWDRTLPEDEARAVDRCLSALSDALGEVAEVQSKSSRGPEAPPSDGASLPARAVAVERVGVSAVRAGVRRRRSQAAGAGGYFAVDHNRNHSPGVGGGGGVDCGGALAVDSETWFMGGAEGNGGLLATTPPRPKKKAARGARDGSPSSARGEPDRRNAPTRVEGRAFSSADDTGSGPGQALGTEHPETAAAVASTAKAADILGGEGKEAPSSSDGLTEGGERETKDADCLPPAIRQMVGSVAEKVAAAGARGATSTDIQSAAAATISLLQAAMKLPSNHALSASNTRPGGAAPKRSPAQQQQQQQQPLEAVCRGLGLDVARGKGARAVAAAAAATAATATAGCGDDLVMAVCGGFVTPALSLRNCLAFVRAVLVPRAQALTTPASRLLVTAVSRIGKSRPGVVIDGLVLPLLCEGDPSAVGSAQCELCTRLIKQVLPKHTLEALLVGLCGTVIDNNDQAADGWGEGPHGGGDSSDRKSDQQREALSRCVWTDLTMPVMTAALNSKPALSDRAIAALVRGIEAAAEQPKLQKSLKFTTLVHSLVTRYGPQLKPHVPVLRAAVGRCSTFMVKAVLAALQRMEK